MCESVLFLIQTTKGLSSDFHSVSVCERCYFLLILNKENSFRLWSAITWKNKDDPMLLTFCSHKAV